MGSRSRTIFMVPAVIMIRLCCASCTTNPRAPGCNGDIPVVAAPDPRTGTFAETILRDLREDHDLAMEGAFCDRIRPNRIQAETDHALAKPNALTDRVAPGPPGYIAPKPGPLPRAATARLSGHCPVHVPSPR